MSNNILVSPPHWCKYAIPSVRGWCDPKTGELLIAIKGIKFDQVKVMEIGEKPEIPAILKMPIKAEAEVEKSVEDVAEIIAEVKEVVEVVKEQPKEEAKEEEKPKKKRGRKKKTAE